MTCSVVIAALTTRCTTAEFWRSPTSSANHPRGHTAIEPHGRTHVTMDKLNLLVCSKQW